jgi:hypothetical protein
MFQLIAQFVVRLSFVKLKFGIQRNEVTNTSKFYEKWKKREGMREKFEKLKLLCKFLKKDEKQEIKDVEAEEKKEIVEDAEMKEVSKVKKVEVSEGADSGKSLEPVLSTYPVHHYIVFKYKGVVVFL